LRCGELHLARDGEDSGNAFGIGAFFSMSAGERITPGKFVSSHDVDSRNARELKLSLLYNIHQFVAPLIRDRGSRGVISAFSISMSQ
jgi:hypothetical protein